MDAVNERLLQLVNDKKTIQEMGADVNLSVGEVHKRLKQLEEGQFIVQEKKYKHRARHLTKWGESYMQSAGYAKVRLFRDY